MPSEAQVAGGHKANISNPNTSIESKQHSEQVLQNEFGIKGELFPHCSVSTSSFSASISLT